MTDIANTLTVDQAVAEFMKGAQEHLASLPPATEARAVPSATFETADAQRFRIAEKLLSGMCPDPGACSDRRCRRDRLCRHIVDLRAMQKAPDPEPHSRRSLGARALPHAIWLYMNWRAARHR